MDACLVCMVANRLSIYKLLTSADFDKENQNKWKKFKRRSLWFERERERVATFDVIV